MSGLSLDNFVGAGTSKERRENEPITISPNWIPRLQPTVRNRRKKSLPRLRCLLLRLVPAPLNSRALASRVQQVATSTSFEDDVLQRMIAAQRKKKAALS